MSVHDIINVLLQGDPIGASVIGETNVLVTSQQTKPGYQEQEVAVQTHGEATATETTGIHCSCI